MCQNSFNLHIVRRCLFQYDPKYTAYSLYYIAWCENKEIIKHIVSLALLVRNDKIDF